MRARDCVWRQPNAADCGPSMQLTGKLARYWVNSLEQGQVRPVRGHNPNNPKKGATLAPGELPPNPVSTEMQNLWPTLPLPNERACGRSLPDRPYRARPDRPNRAQRLA